MSLYVRSTSRPADLAGFTRGRSALLAGLAFVLLSLGGLVTLGAADAEPIGVGQATTTTTAPAGAAVPGGKVRAPDETEVHRENRKLALVIGGLVGVALALGALTAYYWRATRPDGRSQRARRDDRAHDELDDDADDRSPIADPTWDEDPTMLGGSRRAGLGEESRRSRRAVAGADHAEPDDIWTDDDTAIDAAEVDEPVNRRPGRHLREAAFGGDRARSSDG